MGRFYDILDFTLFEGVNKDGIAEFLKNASNKISSYKKGDIVVLRTRKAILSFFRIACVNHCRCCVRVHCLPK